MQTAATMVRSAHVHVILLLLAGQRLHGAAQETETEENHPFCTLKCLNGGVCHKGEGKGQFDFLMRFTPEGSERLPFLEKAHAEAHDMQHCVCPNGYTGLRCEVKLELCGSKNEHVCFNGAPCKSGRSSLGDEIFYCECSKAGLEEPRSFAGRMCEHASTVFCAWGDPRQRAHSFCANGGQCLKTVLHDEQHPGCQCLDGWEGPHCEFREGHSPKKEAQQTTGTVSAPSDASWQAKAAMFTVSLLLICAVLGALFVVIRKHRHDRVKTKSQTPVVIADAGALEADGGTMPRKGPSEAELEGDVDMEAAGCRDGEFT